jgi:hypothetical protein
VASETSKVSWIAAAADAVQLAKNAREVQRKIDDWEDAKRNLARLVREFRLLSAGASVVRPYGWEGRTANPELARAFVEAAETLDSRPLNRVVTALEPFKTEVQSALVESWRVHAAEQIGDVGELQVLATALAGVEGVAELSRQLQTILGDMARIQNSVPSREAAELLRRAEEALGKLEESLQPDSVRRFLSAVARGGASTGLLGADVTDWLRAHNALNSFKIVAGAPMEAADV